MATEEKTYTYGKIYSEPEESYSWNGMDYGGNSIREGDYDELDIMDYVNEAIEASGVSESQIKSIYIHLYVKVEASPNGECDYGVVYDTSTPSIAASLPNTTTSSSVSVSRHNIYWGPDTINQLESDIASAEAAAAAAFGTGLPWGVCYSAKPRTSQSDASYAYYGTEVTITLTLQSGPTLKVVINGTTKEVTETKVCIGGVWKDVSTAHANIGGVWKQS